MSRISIDVTSEQHSKLKALAALSGKSMREFVLERTLDVADSSDDEQALAELEALLDDRIARAKQAPSGTRSAQDIFKSISNGK